MKKYLHIYTTTLIESVQYISSVFISFISFSVIIYVFINLWQYIYQDPNELINGYSVNQMIWYVLITEILWCGTKNKTLLNVQIQLYTGLVETKNTLFKQQPYLNVREQIVSYFVRHKSDFLIYMNLNDFV